MVEKNVNQDLPAEDPYFENDDGFDDMKDRPLAGGQHPDEANIELVHRVMNPQTTGEFIEMSEWETGQVLYVSLMHAQDEILAEMERREKIKAYKHKRYSAIVLECLARTLRGKKRRLIENAITMKQIQADKDIGSTGGMIPGM